MSRIEYKSQKLHTESNKSTSSQLLLNIRLAFKILTLNAKNAVYHFDYDVNY